MQQFWDVPDTDRFNKFCMRVINKKWVEFKYNLAKWYIYGNKYPGEHPSQRYNVDPVKWDIFEAYRRSEEFQVSTFHKQLIILFYFVV